MGIKEGNKVEFDYTLTVDGEVMDTSEGKDPLGYTHGGGQIIPGLSSQLEGMEVGDEKEVEVASEEGYGVIDPEAYKEVPKNQLPENACEGMELQVQTPDGGVFPVCIKEMKENVAVVDFNHPLAGKKLNFKIKIVSVNQ